MDSQLRDQLVKRGAEVELVELRSRMGVLEKLLGRGPRPGRPAKIAVTAKRPGMSAAARKAIGLRMRKYWAERRAQNKKSPNSR